MVAVVVTAFVSVAVIIVEGLYIEWCFIVIRLCVSLVPMLDIQNYMIRQWA